MQLISNIFRSNLLFSLIIQPFNHPPRHPLGYLLLTRHSLMMGNADTSQNDCVMARVKMIVLWLRLWLGSGIFFSSCRHQYWSGGLTFQHCLTMGNTNVGQNDWVVAGFKTTFWPVPVWQGSNSGWNSTEDCNCKLSQSLTRLLTVHWLWSWHTLQPLGSLHTTLNSNCG